MSRTMKCLILGFLSASLVACGQGAPKMSAATSMVTKTINLPAMPSAGRKTKTLDDTLVSAQSDNIAAEPLVLADTPTSVMQYTPKTVKRSDATNPYLPPYEMQPKKADNQNTATTSPTPVSAATPAPHTPDVAAENQAKQPSTPPPAVEATQALPASAPQQETAVPKAVSPSINGSVAPSLTPPVSDIPKAPTPEPKQAPVATPKQPPAPQAVTSGPANTSVPTSTPKAPTATPKTAQEPPQPPVASASQPSPAAAVNTPHPSAANVQKPVVLPTQAEPAKPTSKSLHNPYLQPTGPENNAQTQTPTSPPISKPRSFDEVPVPVLN